MQRASTHFDFLLDPPQLQVDQCPPFEIARTLLSREDASPCWGSFLSDKHLKWPALLHARNGSQDSVLAS